VARFDKNQTKAVLEVLIFHYRKRESVMNKQLDIKRAHTTVPAVADTWNSFRRQIDDLFDNFSDGFQSFSLRPFLHFERSWPRGVGFAAFAVDVMESDKNYTITAELPGVHEKDVDVSISNGNLVIKGEKHQEKTERSENHCLSERSYGSFQRMFGLPSGTDESKVAAQFHNGVLTVTVPKNVEASNARKVDVKAA
jgi:HSP20 family protein